MTDAALSTKVPAWAAALPAIALGGVGLYAYYALYKSGLFKEKPMTEKQKTAITFAHIIVVLGEAIERLTERCERAETDNKTLQESNASLAKEDSKARQDRTSLERQLGEAREEIARLRSQLSEATVALVTRTKKKSKAA